MFDHYGVGFSLPLPLRPSSLALPPFLNAVGVVWWSPLLTPSCTACTCRLNSNAIMVMARLAFAAPTCLASW